MSGETSVNFGETKRSEELIGALQRYSDSGVSGTLSIILRLTNGIPSVVEWQFVPVMQHG